MTLLYLFIYYYQNEYINMIAIKYRVAIFFATAKIVKIL